MDEHYYIVSFCEKDSMFTVLEVGKAEGRSESCKHEIKLRDLKSRNFVEFFFSPSEYIFEGCNYVCEPVIAQNVFVALAKNFFNVTGCSSGRDLRCLYSASEKFFT